MDSWDIALHELKKKHFPDLGADTVGVFIVQNGRPVYFDEDFAAFLGCPVTHLQADPDPFGFIYPSDRQMVIQRFEKQPNGDKAPAIYTYRVVGHDHSIKWVEETCVHIRWENKPARLGIFNDVTERTSSEAEYHKLADHLSWSRKNEAVGTLAGGIAHAFNNLMMGMQGGVSVMLYDLSPDHPHYEGLRAIEKQIKAGARLTSQLLGYARQGRYRVLTLDLPQLVAETVEQFQVDQPGIEFKLDLTQCSTLVEADPKQFRQVLINLYRNAAEAMNGHGTITIECANVTHEAINNPRYEPRPGNYLCLKIEDNGLGMGRAIQNRVFDPFFTTKEMGKGRGLGLASVYGIVKGHSGYIEVDSHKGQGTTFHLFLPQKPKRQAAAAVRINPVLAKPRTVLYADDEFLIMEAADKMLRQLGYRILKAYNGREAVDAFGDHKDEIDLVILDMIMPRMDGGEAYDRIRSIKPDVKVLLSSGYGVDGPASEILARGCDGFLQKPFGIEELSSKIKMLIGEPACETLQ